MPAKRKTAAPVVADAVIPDLPAADLELDAKPAAKQRKPRETKPKDTVDKPPRKPRGGKRGGVHEVVSSKVSSGLMSPRTTASRFAKREDLDDPRNVKTAVNSLSRNLDYAIKAALLIGENGSCTINGREINKKDLTELSRGLTGSVRRLPVVCRQAASKRRGRGSANPEELEACRKNLHDRMVAAANALAAACEIPKIAPALIAKGERRIDARLAKKGAPRTENGAIEKPFYISDNFRRFVAKGEFGNGWAFLYTLPAEAAAISGAENPDAALAAATEALGFDPAKKLGLTAAEAKKVANPRNIFSNLLVQRGIATSPILMSLMSAYINACGLRDAETNRIRVDDTMNKLLGKGTTTEHMYSNKNYTPADKVDECKLSGLERLATREGKGEAVPYDGVTFTRPMNIVLANFYRVSNPSEDLASKLSHPAILDLCSGVKLFL